MFGGEWLAEFLAEFFMWTVDRPNRNRNRIEPVISMKPFRLFAWVGSKQKMMSQLLGLVPAHDSFESYHEPFCGSASLFFNMKMENKQVFLNDANAKVVNVFLQAQSNPAEFRAVLERLQREFDADVATVAAGDISRKQRLAKEFYYSTLDRCNCDVSTNPTDKIESAGLFVFMMSLTYGAIYLENDRSLIVPGFGPRTRIASKSWKAYNMNEIDRALSVLQKNRVHLSNGDFVSVLLENARPNDFVFLDPPYLGTRITRYVRRYEFDDADQRRLFDAFEQLTERGVKIMMTNMNTESVRSQYAKYRQVPLVTRRDLAREETGAHEIAILNY